MAIKFLSDIDVTGSYNLQASDIPDISGTYATIAYITAQGFLTTLPAHNHDDRYYTKSQSDAKYLLVGGETDPIFLASPAYGITAQKITNWDTAFGWGDHSSRGYITEAVGNTLYQPIGNYDNYGSWNLKTNSVQRTTVQSGGTLDIIAGTNVTVSYSSGGKVTIASTDTNTTYSAGTGLTLTGTTFAVGDLSGTYSTVDHTHPIEEINGLQDALDGKADIGHTHSYLPLAGGTVTGMTIFEDGMRIGTGNHNTDGRASITFGEGTPTNDTMYIEYDGENLSGDNNAIIFGSGKAGVGDIFRVTYGGSVLVGSNAVATESYVDAAVSNLVDAAPGTLNTLNELAAALGDDPNFATTITTAIGSKADASHTHEISDINNLQTELDGKQPVGSYAAASHNHDDRYYTETESDLRYSIYRGELGTSNDVGSTTGWANNLKAGTYSRNYTGHSGQVLVSHDTGGSVGNIALEATYYGAMYVHTNVDSNAWVTKQIWTSSNFTTTDISNWNTAYGWGDHAGLYAAASHTHSEYLKYNPDGDGGAISYDDSNPTINGVAIGGGHWFGADGNPAGGYLAARVLHAQGITSSIGGYYVGEMNISAGGDSTAVIDGFGNWVGVSIPDNKIASSANWNTAYGWGNHADAGYLTSVTNISGNAATATKLQTARTIALSGDVSGSATFDGSGNITISTEVANDSHSHTILSALNDYVFNAGTNGRNFSRGIQTSFVGDGQSYPSYGSVMRIATYSGLNDGGTAEMYFPYSPTYGGDTIKYRLGLYNNAGWSQWFNVASREWVTAQGFAAGTHQHDGGDIVSGTIAAERIADLSGTYAVADHTHSYLPLSGGTLTGDVTTSGNIKGANLQLSGATPTLYFNGTNDGGDYTSSDMAIKATPEGLDFYEPEDGNKIHFQILDDLGVNSPFGYQWNGQSLDTRYAASSHTHTFASLTSKPTTLSGYGITDAASSTHTHDALYWRKATMETQNPVGVTYGQGVSSVPPYYIGQLTGDNDGWRIYGEAPSTNDVKVIFEVIDDLEAGDTWVFRNKQTYSPYLATEAFIIEGNGNIKANGTVTATGGNSTQWNTAYGWGNHGAAGYATPQDITDAINNLVDGAPAALDTLNELAAAINDNASYASTVTTALSGKVAKSGDTMTGDLTMSGDSKVVFGPNSGWGKYLIIGGNGNSSTANHASIGVTNGNLHIDAAISSATYLNFYDGTAGVVFGNGAAGIVAWMGPDGDLWKGSSDNNGNKYWHAGDFANNSSNWDTAFGWGNHATAGYGSAGDTAKGVEAFGWGNHANAGYQDAASAITTSNIGSQSVSYATSASAAGYSNLLLREDNRTISPSELGAAYMKFGFTSWNNNNTAPYADFLHLRSYTDSSGGNDNLVMFKKSGIGMRIWQQSWGSASAYSSYADVWTSADFSSTNVGNWNTAYGWGNHANAGYLTSLGTAILDGDFTSNGLMKRTGAGTYAVVTDNSSNWNTAYGWGNHAGLYAASTHQHDASAIVSGQFAAELIPDLSGTYAVADHSHSYLPLSGGTVTGLLTLTGSSGVSRLRIEGQTPTIDLYDSDSGADRFYIHVNSNNFYILTDRNGAGAYGDWEAPHPLQLEADTNKALIFGSEVKSAAFSAATDFATSNHSHLNADSSTDGFLSASDFDKFSTAFNWGDHSGLYLPIGGGTITRTSTHVTQGSISASNAHLDLYNNWQSNTDQKGSILTFTDNYFDGTNYIKTTRAAIKGGTDTIGNTADGYLEFYVDSAGANSPNLAMRIASNGSINISGYGTEGAYLQSNGSFRIDIDSDNDHTDRAFIVSRNGAANDLFYIKEDGNVGIGTNSPSGKLHSYISENRQMGHNAVGADLGVISDNNTQPVLYVKGTGTADLVNVLDGTTNVFTIKDGGNVGIGTTSPASTLQIGSVGSTNYSVPNGLAFGDGTRAAALNVESSGVNFYSSSHIKFSPNTTEAVRITTAGNVGIGTTSPTEKLDVNGNVRVNGTLEATEKSFNIEHPTKPGKRLIYGVLEGPEHAVYVRGRATGGVIELPEEWTGLVDESTITVQLTPIGRSCAWVEDVKDNKVYYGIDHGHDCFYFVQATRKDVPNLITERDA